jgi:hypothetical protein
MLSIKYEPGSLDIKSGCVPKCSLNSFLMSNPPTGSTRDRSILTSGERRRFENIEEGNKTF